MSECPTCGERVDHPDTAGFCSQCGATLNGEKADAAPEPEASAAVQPESSEDDSGDQLDSAETIHRDDEQAEAQFVQAVKQTIADGVLDARDENSLRDTQDRLRLSDARAATLKDEAISSVICPAEETVPSEQAPVSLEMNINHFTVQDYMCVLDFQLTNHCDSRVSKVVLAVRGAQLGNPKEWRLSLQPKERRDRMIQIKPKDAGMNVIEIMLSFMLDGKASTWSVQHRLKVFEKTVMPSNVVIKGPTFNASDNAKMGYGMLVKGQPNDDLAKGLFKTINDLLEREYPPMWRTLRLRREQEDVDSVVQPLPPSQPVDTRIVDQKTSFVFGGGEVVRRVMLLGLAHIRMGRRREENDVVLRCFPRSKENDDLTLQIQGGPHILLSLRREGLMLSDGDTLNGTMLNGMTVKGKAPIPLDRPSEVDVGKALRLRVVPFLADSKDDNRYALLGQTDDLWRISEGLGLRSVLIQRVDNLAGEEDYLIVYRWAEIGSGLGNELLMPDGQLKHKHMRLVRAGGQFWLESLVDGGLAAGGMDLGRGQACPLAVDTELDIAGTTARITRFEQHGLG
jgi:uncharacterized Zn finger protein (UPF0148 family)